MRRYGLIGRKLGHSLSKELFDGQGFDAAEYMLQEMASLDGLRRWVEAEDIRGFNVTIPYKREIIPLLDAMDDTAAEIGAVNCVSVEHGYLMGHNTDAEAFADTFWPLDKDTLCLIMGTGGAARAVGHALRNKGYRHLYVSRTPEAAQVRPTTGYKEALRMIDGKVAVINATPVGMHPNSGDTPLPLTTIRRPLPDLHVYDLVYNPAETRLMREATALGARAKNGLDMLRRQAESSWAIWGL